MTERLYIANFSPHEVAFRFYGYGTTIHRVIAVGGHGMNKEGIAA